MKKSRLIFSLITMISDFLGLSVSLLLAYIIRTNVELRPLATSTNIFEYLNLVFMLSIIGIIIFFFNNLYNIKSMPEERLEELKKVFIAVSAGFMIIIALDFIKINSIFPAKAIPVYAWILAIIFVSLFRQILKFFQKYLYKYGIGVQNIIIIGANRISHSIITEIKNKPHLGYNIIDVLDKRKIGEKFLNHIVGNEDNILEIIKKKNADEVIQANPQMSHEKVVELINITDDYKINFKFAPSLFGVYSTNINVNVIAGIPIVQLKKTPLDGWGRITKRLIDMIGSLFFLTILSPVFLIITIIIKFNSKGPVFYKHKRLGRHGKEFEMYKFRSMKIDFCRGDKYGGCKAEENFNKIMEDPEKKKEFENDFKLKNDPRVTSFGKFLRKTSLDEFPQLLNVLKGEMSLVGPRPVVKEELDKYGESKNQRLMLKPGMTGLWQISGRSNLTYKERANLDIYYIEHWSLFLDFKILIKTSLIFFKRDAY